MTAATQTEARAEVLARLVKRWPDPRRLPPKVFREKSRHGKTVYYFREGKGERVRMPVPGTREFWTAYAEAMAGPNQPQTHNRRILVQKIAVEDKARALIVKTVRNSTRKARERARRKGVPYNLTADWGEDQVRRQGYRCALSGVPFFMQKERVTKHHPYMPSLDRIEPKLGYVIGNVRIVTFAMNMMLSDWGEEVFHRTIQGYQYQRRAGIRL